MKIVSIGPGSPRRLEKEMSNTNLSAIERLRSELTHRTGRLASEVIELREAVRELQEELRELRKEVSRRKK